MKNYQIDTSVIYEDNHLILCHKPAGIAVQTNKSAEKDMVSLLKNYLFQATGKQPYLGVIHRLDQPVEGLILFAKTPFAAKELSRQLNSSEMCKKYLAVTESAPEKICGQLTDYLLKDGKTNTSKIVSKDTPGAKKATLNYRVLKSLPQHCFLEIELLTGRHHQIRVQLAGMDTPLLGDTKYCPREKERPASSIGLCAYDLTFVHPKTKKVMHFQIRPYHSIFESFYG